MNIEVIFEDNIIDVIEFGNVVLSTAGLSPDDVYTKVQTDTLLGTKQDELISGTNIKTINNTSLLGTGNIDISGGGTSDHSLLTNRDIANQHTISSITDLQTTLDGKSATNHNHTLASLSEKSYNSLTDIPTSFTPSSHTQAISTIDNLQTELNSKQVTLVSGTNIKSINGTTLLGSGNIEIGGTGTTDHSMLTNRDLADQHPISAVTGLQTALNSKADTDSVYTISEMNTLLNTKSDTSHNHSLANLSEKSYNSLTDTPELFSGSYNDLSDIPITFPPSAHNQAISTITGLQDELNIKIEQASCGALSNAICTDNGNGTINVPSLDVTLYNGIRVEKYTLATTNNIALTDNVMNYIVADYNSGSPIIKNITNVTLIDELYIIPLCSIYRNGIYLHTQHWDALGFNLANKIHRSIVKTERYRRESGLSLSVNGTRNVALTQGTVYVGAVENILNAIDSTIDNILFYTHVAGVWTLSTNTQLNNTQYDNGANLVSLTANRYAINWLYRGVESQKHLYCVLGDGDYTLTQAQTAQPPSIPTAISSHAVLVGRVIIQLNSNTATQIDSAFDVTFNQASTTVHNDLSGLNDGDFKHLTSDEYNNRAEISDIPTALSSFTKDINFDERYYTETEINTKLLAKSDTSHNHTLNSLSEKSYNSLTDKPNLFSGSYTDLSNKPTEFAPSAHTQAISTITGLQTALDDKINNYTRSTGLISLTIDCSTADIFEVSLSANASFSLTNVPTNKEKKFIITNSGASEITITYPNTADYWESATFKISAGKKKVTALEYNGTTRFWYLSAELKNA